jgi:hypothetical protein
MERRTKTFKLNYWADDDNVSPHITLLEGPDEVRIGVSDKSFVSVKDRVVTIAAGPGGKVNVQGFPDSFRYGAMLKTQSFPMSLIPSTVVTPIAHHTLAVPFAGILKELKQAAMIASVFVGG